MAQELGDHDHSVADRVGHAVEDHGWIERAARIGWIAKGLVYTLMGVTAYQIAGQGSVDDEASPEGSLGRVAEAPFGRTLLVVLTVGLLLYVAWRFLSVFSIRGNGASEWGDRVGYTFSALFYLVLAYSAGKSAVVGIDPAGSTSVETISRTLLDVTAGRYLLGFGGLVTIAIGLYFAVDKGIGRSFVKHLVAVCPSLKDNEAKRQLMVISGVIGWIGRGIVTIMVGGFIVQAAYSFDSNDARGFDRALREHAATSLGSVLVYISAVGLIVYGVFCFLTYRARSLESP